MRPDTKTVAIRSYISKLAYEKGPHVRLPTIRELCERFATSRVTLDEVLYTLEQQQVIYRKQGSGIFVSPKIFHKSIAILLNTGYLSGTGASPFWGMLWGILAQEARQRAQIKAEYHSFTLVVEGAESETPLPKEIVTMIQDKRIDAIMAIALHEDALNWLREQTIPCIGFGSFHPYSVKLDSAALADLAVQRLAEQGCRKIALWSTSMYDGKDEWVSSWQVEPTFRETLDRYQLPFRPGLVRNYLAPRLSASTNSPLPYQEQGYLVAKDVFGDPDGSKPDGILITDDMMTDGALAALRQLGVRIGEDVKIVTHGNTGSMMSFNYIPGLTVFDFNPHDIVNALFDLLDIALHSPETTPLEMGIRPQLRQPTS